MFGSNVLACMTSHHMYEEARAPAVLMGAASSLGSGFTSRGGMAAQDDLAKEMQAKENHHAWTQGMTCASATATGSAKVQSKSTRQQTCSVATVLQGKCVSHVLARPHLQEVIQPTSHDHRAG